MYIKQESESCSSVKNYPSVKKEMVFSDYTKRRILVLRRRGNYQAPYFSTSTTGKLSSDHFEAATKRRNKSELARDFNVFAKVQTKLHNW